jgi:geranylgeranylglycerol-phosphate geranylgeranyltransferase
MRSERLPTPMTAERNVTAALLSLLRPLNIAVTFLSVAAAGVIAGAGWADIDRLLLAATAGSLIAAAGNVSNDMFDIAIDRINKPGRALAASRVSPTTAGVFGGVLAAAGLLFSIPLGTVPFLIAAGTACALYLYNARLKRLPLVGNLVVAALTGLAFLYGAVVFDNAMAGVIPALFAFTFNLARELLKDIEDMEGDGRLGISTFPLRAGIPATLALVSVLLLVIMSGSVLPWLFSVYNATYLWVVIFGVDSLLLVVLFAMWNDRSTGNIARLTLLLKYDMPVGIIAIVLGTRG